MPAAKSIAFIALGLSALAPGACTSAHPAAAPAVFAWTDIQPILTPLTYRALWARQCGEPGVAPVSVFLDDLKASGASTSLVAQARAESRRIAESVRDEEDEYVCTVELAESTENNAAAAQIAWADMKRQTP